ncbi:glutamine--fructose-6-phosphate transaminase (isomerizing) [Halovenus rubra]|uniref:Glutamine--fructose-6-phosphate aminotransferase [isomerizing] n=2 Tax=Halovenus rubra TaxID=869890 RepID=A0ABD5X6Y0_9EURY|nr:glutamine--fructose-6-phosphate transaminase (isomerizing) [Halovenus rubra]
MCGIIGCIGRGSQTLDTLVHGLSKLEYRGYDSAGVALGGTELSVSKTAGEVADLREKLNGQNLRGGAGIAHTRWSTHGPPTDENAHPHTDCADSVTVVHNGIIENYQSLRDQLVSDGHTFTSDTDTEVVPHLIETYLSAGENPADAFRAAINDIQGSYAIAALIDGANGLFAARNDSPLVVGLGDGADFNTEGGVFYLASDVPAFRDFTDEVVYLEDGEFVRFDRGIQVTDRSGTVVDKDVHTIDWDAEETGKSGYDHFMLKEIYEQPRALRQCLRGRIEEQTATVDIGDLGGLNPTGVQLVACGTSYHAAKYGAQLFRDAGVSAQALLAHEYATAPPPIGNDLVVGISQSGETADTLSALREARRRGARTLTVTNTVGSTMDRECDHTLYIRSGPEIGVAATKTFAGQLTALNLLSLATSEGSNKRRTVVPALRDLAGHVQRILDSSAASTVAEQYDDAESYFFIGRGYQHPVALEGALKLKEISYEHAEGFAAGELKHGSLALVDENTPVFAIVVGDGEKAQKTVGNIKEVEARDAPVVAVTDGQSDAERYADHVLTIPESRPRTAAVLANVQLQLVAYHVADRLGRSIDKPRNLAKSVTVE